MIKTLRGRLAACYLGIVALALVLFTVLLYAVLDATLDPHHDAELTLEAEQVLRTLAATPLRGEAIGAAVAHSRYAARFIMVRSRDGELLYQSPLLEVSEPNIGRHEALVHAAAAGPATPQFFTAQLERWGPVRFICLPIDTSGRAYLQVGMPLGDVATTQRTITIVSLALIPVVLALMSAGGWLVAGRALAPLRSMDETLRSIQATDLSRRIDIDPADAELGRLVTTLNHLLGRLEQAFASAKQFAGDVSHQLHTPLTVMKGTLDVALATPRTPADYERTLTGLADEVDRMAAVLADLRTLGLADSGPDAGQRGPVAISQVALEAAEILEALAESREVSFDVSIEHGLTVWGNVTALQQVVLNLGDNAVKYTQAGGGVRVELHGDAHDVVLRVVDTGIGIPAEHLPHVFDRFYRGADAQTAGTGLGLAIVKRIVDAHGGSVQVQSRPGAGSTFTVRLPRAPG